MSQEQARARYNEQKRGQTLNTPTLQSVTLSDIVKKRTWSFYYHYYYLLKRQHEVMVYLQYLFWITGLAFSGHNAMDINMENEKGLKKYL